MGNYLLKRRLKFAMVFTILSTVLHQTASANKSFCTSFLANRQSPPNSDPHPTPQQAYNAHFNIPSHFLRITKIDPEHLFSEDGYVRNHSYLVSSGGGYYARTVPMVHPEDLSTVLKLFSAIENSGRPLYVLVIDSTKARFITNSKHPKLPVNGQYYAEVPKEAVISIMPLNEYLTRRIGQ